MADVQEPITQTGSYLIAVSMLTDVGDFPWEWIREVKIDSEYEERNQRWAIKLSIDKTLYEQKPHAVNESFFDIPENQFKEGNNLCVRFFADDYGNYLGMDEPNSL